VRRPLWTDAVAAAPALGVDLARVEMRGPAELDAALARLASARADALCSSCPTTPPCTTCAPAWSPG
jgi:hypothetical protein